MSSSTALIADIRTAPIRSNITNPLRPPTDDVGSVIGHVASHHHAAVRRELPRLDDLLSNVMVTHGERDPDLAPIADRFATLCDRFYAHLHDQEHTIFPLAIQLLGAVVRPTLRAADIDDLVRDTRAENDEIGTLLADLLARSQCISEPTSSSEDWSSFRRGIVRLHADTREHLHVEHAVLFPAMLTLNTSLD